MTRVLIGAAVLFATLPTTSAFAQNANPMTAAAKGQFNMIKGNLAKTAAKVGEEHYAFKPTPEVRSLGQLIGHVADANFMICAAAAGEKPPQGGFEKGKTSKADLSKGLNDSLAYCDSVLAKMDDTKGVEIVKFFGQDQPRLAVLFFNVEHDNEHYGNLVTYMRLKGIVPPSSESTR
jgi:uncharacterized damage-inducible protein DinB